MENKEKDRNNHRAVTTILENIYVRKNADYGDSFTELMNDLGYTASAVYLTAKVNRFKKLMQGESLVKEESIEDTLLDLANYAIMTYIWHMESKNE